MLQRKSDRERYDYSQGPRRRLKVCWFEQNKVEPDQGHPHHCRYITEWLKMFRAASGVSSKNQKAGNRYQARPPPLFCPL